jgi:hypothetical protein
MPIDIFPDLNVPVLYVAQPYGGLDPQQMEGFLTNYYEYHFLYITGIDHVESKNIQSVALMKLYFHPGTNMAQAMAEVIGYVTRSRAFMPPLLPFISLGGSVPVGYPLRGETHRRDQTRPCSTSGRYSRPCPAFPPRLSAATSAPSSSAPPSA